MESAIQTVQWSQGSQDGLDRAYARWMTWEQEALKVLLGRGMFTDILHPFNRLGMREWTTLRIPGYVLRGALLDPDAVDYPPVRSHFESCDVSIGKSTKGARSVIHRYLKNHKGARPASFQDLTSSDAWKTLAGPSGNVPRLMLPGVVFLAKSCGPMVPVIDYVLPEFSDGVDGSLGFVLRAVPPRQLRSTGMRALFVMG